MDPFKTLNIDPRATKKQIKKAYRKLAWKLHPDRNPNADIERLKRVNAAYDLVKDGLYRHEEKPNYYEPAKPKYRNPPKPKHKPKPKNLHYRVTLTLKSTLWDQILRVQTDFGEAKITVPAGIKSSTLTAYYKDQPFWIHVKIEQNKDFSVDGFDLIKEVLVNADQETVKTEALSGEWIRVKANLRDGGLVRLKGMGMPTGEVEVITGNRVYGDLYLKVRVI